MRNALENCVSCGGGSYGGFAHENGKKAQKKATVSSNLAAAYQNNSAGLRVVAAQAGLFAKDAGKGSGEQSGLSRLDSAYTYKGRKASVRVHAVQIADPEDRIRFVAYAVATRLGLGDSTANSCANYVVARAAGVFNSSAKAWRKLSDSDRARLVSLAETKNITATNTFDPSQYASSEQVAAEEKAASYAADPQRLARLSAVDRGIFRYLMARRAARMANNALAPRFAMIQQQFGQFGGRRGARGLLQRGVGGPMQQKLAALEAELAALKLQQEEAAAAAKAQADAALAAAQNAQAIASAPINVQVSLPGATTATAPQGATSVGAPATTTVPAPVQGDVAVDPISGQAYGYYGYPGRWYRMGHR